jgi:hypothetical protein
MKKDFEVFKNIPPLLILDKKNIALKNKLISFITSKSTN